MTFLLDFSALVSLKMTCWETWPNPKIAFDFLDVQIDCHVAAPHFDIMGCR